MLTGTNIISVRSVNSDDHTVFSVIQYVFQYYVQFLTHFLTLYEFTFNCSCCCIVALTTMPSVIGRATGKACVMDVGSGTIACASLLMMEISVPSVFTGTNSMSVISSDLGNRTVFHFNHTNVIVFVLMLHVVHNVQCMGIAVQVWHLEMLRISVLCSLSTFMFIST